MYILSSQSIMCDADSGLAKYNIRRGNIAPWLATQFGELEAAGVSTTMWRKSNTLKGAVALADYLGVEVAPDYDFLELTVYNTDDPNTKLFYNCIGEHRGVSWEAGDWDLNRGILSIHFTK